MGRDTTASKRMAAKRSREKADGLRRLNVAVKPEVFDRLAELMKQHNCTSQARLVELLVMDIAKVASSDMTIIHRTEVTNKDAGVKRKTSPTKTSRGKIKAVEVQMKLSTSQMSLFDS